MRNRTVKQYIVLGFSAVVLIMVMLSAFALVLLYQIRGKVADITAESWPGLYFSSQIQSLSVETVGSVYKHVLSSDAYEERQLEGEIAANQTKMDDAAHEYEKTVFRDQDRQSFASLVAARTACEDSYKPALQLSRDGKTSEAEVRVRQQVDPSCAVFHRATQAEVQDNKSLGDESMRGILNTVSHAEQAVILGLAIGLLLTGLGGFMLIRSINQLAGQVQESSLRVSTSSTEIAATSQEQLSTANEIAATTSEIGATAKQISVTSKELVQTMKEVADVAEKTTALASSGQVGLGRMKVTVQQIVEASTSITDRLAVLNEKAGNIGTVVTTITKVADQTNLLSLNAAIEAEKAGEYGRGFAVVATEIRRLADQTAISTSDIEQTVKEIQSAVAAGVMGMDKFSEEVRRGVDVVQQVSEELTQIIQQAQTLTPSFETVSEGMQSQAVGAQQISDALSQLSEAATQTVGSLRQSNAAVEQLNVAARGLQSGISRFALQA